MNIHKTIFDGRFLWEKTYLFETITHIEVNSYSKTKQK